jgi:hypothetical protein
MFTPIPPVPQLPRWHFGSLREIKIYLKQHHLSQHQPGVKGHLPLEPGPSVVPSGTTDLGFVPGEKVINKAIAQTFAQTIKTPKETARLVELTILRLKHSFQLYDVENRMTAIISDLTQVLTDYIHKKNPIIGF